jgi:DtxR family Mn-dependent transcriptional regulator
VISEISYTEENYIKAIYHLSSGEERDVSTNAIADAMQTKPATVSDMIKRLALKKLISYEKYRGVSLTPDGQHIALKVIRKHRLWEVFLVDKLKFNWDEVHEIAEQMEHIQSTRLVERLDEFLNFPTIDTHGDPIPDSNGKFTIGPVSPLTEMNVNDKGVVTTVKQDDTKLLQYLDQIKVRPGTKIKILDKQEYDQSMHIELEGGQTIFLSERVSSNLMITKIV